MSNSGLLYILLQPPQPLLGFLQHRIILTNGKPDIILRDMRIPLGIKLRRRDRRNAHLLDQEPREPEVPRTRRHMRREGVAFGDLHLAHVDEDKVAALGVGEGHAELGPDGVEAVHLGLHVAHGGVPEGVGVGLLEGYGAGFLEGRDGGVADAGVGGCYVLNEFGGPNEPACGTLDEARSGVAFCVCVRGGGCIRLGIGDTDNIPTRQPVA